MTARINISEAAPALSRADIESFIFYGVLAGVFLLVGSLLVYSVRGEG